MRLAGLDCSPQVIILLNPRLTTAGSVRRAPGDRHPTATGDMRIIKTAMKILIVGSMKQPTSKAEFQSFQNACREIGKELATNGHTILLGSDSNKTADRYVMEGLSSARGQHNVIVYYSEMVDVDEAADENRVPFPKADLPTIRIRHKPYSGPWSVAHTAGINAADVTLLIGGARRCDLVGHMARALGKPVLAMRFFGGAAEAVWKEINSAYDNCGISEQEMESLRVWKGGSASAVAVAAQKLYKHSLHRQKSIASIIAISSITLLSFIAWVLVFVFASRQAVGLNPSFFWLLFLSTMMGTGLRVLTIVRRDWQYKIDPSQLYAELAASSILSFAFMLLYLIGAFLLTGKFEQLSRVEDFTRVAITFSVLGLAAAFLPEPATKELDERLKAILKKKK